MTIGVDLFEIENVLLALLRRFDPAAPSVGAAEPMSTTPFTEILA